MIFFSGRNAKCFRKQTTVEWRRRMCVWRPWQTSKLAIFLAKTNIELHIGKFLCMAKKTKGSRSSFLLHFAASKRRKSLANTLWKCQIQTRGCVENCHVRLNDACGHKKWPTVVVVVGDLQVQTTLSLTFGSKCMYQQNRHRYYLLCNTTYHSSLYSEKTNKVTMDQKDFQWNPWSEKRERRWNCPKKEMSKEVAAADAPSLLHGAYLMYFEVLVFPFRYLFLWWKFHLIFNLDNCWVYNFIDCRSFFLIYLAFVQKEILFFKMTNNQTYLSSHQF